jgi:hypothetical protein
VADESTPTFAIPKHPTRRYQRRGGVEYDGETVFSLRPEVARDDESLTRLVERVIDGEPYRYGDWFDLPMPLYSVHDDRTGDTFRAAVRDGAIELHVLPDTGSEGLRVFYRRIEERSETDWDVTCRTD